MLWVDYREKLGLGFSDKEKFKLLQTKIVNFIQALYDNDVIPYSNISYFEFCNMTGTLYDSSDDPLSDIADILSSNKLSMKAFISLYVAFVNTYNDKDDQHKSIKKSRKFLLDALKEMMQDVKIGFEVQKDEDNDEYFIFPKGAPELDFSLVSEPLEWLSEYPQAQKTFIIALKQYSDGVYKRDVADNFRKALEAFLKEFFGNSRNLEKNINEVEKYLKEQGGDAQITNIFASILSCYDKLNNEVAKHNDKIDAKFLEFLMYQTGLFIRMLIVVKRAEK